MGDWGVITSFFSIWNAPCTGNEKPVGWRVDLACNRRPSARSVDGVEQTGVSLRNSLDRTRLPSGERVATTGAPLESGVQGTLSH